MTQSAPAEVIVRTSTRVLDQAWKVDLAGLLLVGVVSLVGYLAGVGPYFDASEEIARHEEALAAAVQDRNAAMEVAAGSKMKLENSRKQAREEQVELRPVNQRHVQIGAIAELAQESKVAVDNITPSDAMAVKGVASVVRVPITLTGKGSYSQVTQFLGALHEKFRDTSVASMQVTARPGTGGAVATFSVVLHWYARPDMPS